MVCPLCGPHCRCSEPNAFLSGGAGARDSSFLDPESDDGSEERFAASLESEDAGFDSDGLLDGPVSGFSPEQERGILGSSSRSDRTAERPLRSSSAAALASSTPPPASVGPSGAPVFVHSAPLMKNDSQQVPAPVTSQTSTWHDEVVSRVESYRRRRNRPRRERSLPLDFDSPWTTTMAATATAAAPPVDAVPEDVAEPQMIAAPVVAPADLPPVAPDSLPAERDPILPREEEDEYGSNLIVFPRPTAAAPPIEELAEPLLNGPRILDVPEEVDSASAPLADLSLESEERPGFLPDLAAIVAPISQRLLAGALDAMLALVGSLVFAALVSRSAPQLLTTRGGLAALATASAVFWTLYHYLFLVHGRGTPGMLLADLSLIHFDGTPVPPRLLRWRAPALLLSTLSLALGLLWALFDEDGLCWHDRITRSYPVWKAAGY